MYRLVLILSIFILLGSACEEKNSPPSPSGEVTVSSEIFGSTVYYVNGYSFEEEKFVPSLNSGSSVPDIIPVNELNVDGDVIGMVFSAGPNNGDGFYINFESSDIGEAENFYNQYSSVEFDQFSPLTDTLRAGQVYTFKTYKGNYVKFLIEGVRMMTQSVNSDYVEADIKYFIQRDGATEFQE